MIKKKFSAKEESTFNWQYILVTVWDNLLYILQCHLHKEINVK